MSKGSKNISSSKENELIPQVLIRKFFTGAIGICGVGGILYGTGFLILRAHYSFLGVWGGITLSNTQITEEGGRFFYHLLFIPISLFASINWKHFLLILFPTLIIDLLFRVMSKGDFFKTKFKKLPPNLCGLIATSLIVVMFLATAILSETNWIITSYVDVLRSPEILPPQLLEPSARTSLYSNVVFRTLPGIFIALVLHKYFWISGSKIQKFLILLQWLLVFATVTILPLNYGKLILPTTFNTIQHTASTDKEDVLLLLGKTCNSWIVWNSNKKQTEILPQADNKSVVIGKKQSIF